jgi:hypothetical protein
MIENRELLSLENPRYSTLIREYEHLKEVHMDDDDPKDLLPIHLILAQTPTQRYALERNYSWVVWGSLWQNLQDSVGLRCHRARNKKQHLVAWLLIRQLTTITSVHWIYLDWLILSITMSISWTSLKNS